MNIDMIEAVNARLAGRVRRTPLLASPFLDEIAGRRVFVKPECLQHTGSFKFRGAWSAVSALPAATRAKGVIAYSSGNHAQGVAHAAELMGVPAVIVMPEDAPALKLANTRAHGAEVVLYDRVSGENREEIGGRIAAERGLALIRPFDEPMVMAGQGTCGLEIARQAAALDAELDAVLICCGGGGLTAGCALALAELSPRTAIYTVEPEAFDDTARSLAGGARVANDPAARSFCDALLAPSPGHRTLHTGGDTVRRADRNVGLHAALPQRALAVRVGRVHRPPDPILVVPHVAVGHHDGVDVGIDKLWFPRHGIGHAVDIVPASRVVADEVPAERGADLHELKRSLQLLDKDIDLDRADRQGKVRLEGVEHVVPQRRLLGGLDLW